MSDRLARFAALLAADDLDGALISHPANRFYLSGYSADDHAPDESAGVLLLGPTLAELWTGQTNLDWAAAEAPAFVGKSWTRPWSNTIAARIKELSWRRIGFEDAALTVGLHQALRSSLEGAAELVPLGSNVDRLRLAKDDGEIATLERALGLTCAVFDAVAPRLTPGRTEVDVAWEIERLMRERGAEGVAFSVAVASGPNAARPHHGVTDRALKPGEPIVIDLGARVTGYNGDLTRTVWLGEPDAKLKAVYNVVLAAQEAALRALKPGMTGKEADAVAREVIVAAGYGDAFVHGLGHGLGVRIHEGPSLGQTSDDVLAVGQVVTVEPGVYLPGWGGVRIEDVVVIEPDGCRILTSASKAPAF